jgi:hypothetical protein
VARRYLRKAILLQSLQDVTTMGAAETGGAPEGLLAQLALRVQVCGVCLPALRRSNVRIQDWVCKVTDVQAAGAAQRLRLVHGVCDDSLQPDDTLHLAGSRQHWLGLTPNELLTSCCGNVSPRTMQASLHARW